MNAEIHFYDRPWAMMFNWICKYSDQCWLQNLNLYHFKFHWSDMTLISPFTIKFDIDTLRDSNFGISTTMALPDDYEKWPFLKRTAEEIMKDAKNTKETWQRMRWLVNHGNYACHIRRICKWWKFLFKRRSSYDHTFFWLY